MEHVWYWKRYSDVGHLFKKLTISNEISFLRNVVNATEKPGSPGFQRELHESPRDETLN